jgi:hypothetical protein
MTNMPKNLRPKLWTLKGKVIKVPKVTKVAVLYCSETSGRYLFKGEL